MSRSVSAPSSVTKTSPCWNGFIVPGSTLRYGSSFCMVTRSPRAFSRAPRLEAVSPLPSEEATPPVTKRCLVVVLFRPELAEWGCAKRGLPWLRLRRCRPDPAYRLQRCRGGGLAAVSSTSPRSTSLSAPWLDRVPRPRSAARRDHSVHTHPFRRRILHGRVPPAGTPTDPRSTTAPDGSTADPGASTP